VTSDLIDHPHSFAEGHALPAIDGLFEARSNGLRLLGSRCLSCGAPYFPRTQNCRDPACRDPRLVETSFGGRGTLWSFSIECYPPPEPVLRSAPFAPFAVGMVDLDDGLRLLGRIEIDDFSRLRVDMEVQLVAGPIGRDDMGVERVSWKFAPLVASGRSSGEG
jgi:uncharacterized protein